MVRRRLAVLVALNIFAFAAGAEQNPNTPPPPPAPEKVEAPKVPTSLPVDQTGLPIDPKTYGDRRRGHSQH